MPRKRRRPPPQPEPKRRRAKGTGGVTYNRARDRYLAVLAGQTKSFREETEALAWLDAQVAARDLARSGGAPPPAPDRQPVWDALQEMINDADWIAPTTRAAYMSQGEHIHTYIGAKAIGDVTADDIAAMDRALRAEYAGGTVRNVMALAQKLYRRLIALRRVDWNPVDAYRTITPARARAGRPARLARPVDAGVARRILEKMADDPYQTIVAWMFVLGLRSGEARGLRWVNVDLAAATCRIVEQRRPSDRHTPAPLKTERELGVGRELPVPAALLAMTPRPSADSPLVFPNPRDGTAMDDGVLLEHFKKACTAAGVVPHIRVHDCRHTCATGLGVVGAREELIAAVLGHKRKSTTGRYQAIPPDVTRPYVDEWAAAVLPPRPVALRRVD